MHHTGYFLLVLVYRVLTRMASSLLEGNTSTELHSSTLLGSYMPSIFQAEVGVVTVGSRISETLLLNVHPRAASR